VHETFKKVLYISPAVRGEFSSGRVFNLVTSDAETLQLLTQNIMGLISSPLRIIVAVLMLYLELGVSSLVAIGVLVMLMPTQVQFCQESQAPSLCHAWLSLALEHHWQYFVAPWHHCSHAHALPGAGCQLSRGSACSSCSCLHGYCTSCNSFSIPLYCLPAIIASFTTEKISINMGC